MSKILLVGSPARHSGEGVLAHGFGRLGWETSIWDNKLPAWWLFHKNWWCMGNTQKLLYDSIRSLQFFYAASAWKPDVLFLPKAENLHSYAIKRTIQRTKSKLAVWNPDNPFKDDMTSMNILRTFKRVDLYYIWGKFLIEPLLSAGCSRVKYLPFAFDPDLHVSVEQLTSEEIARFGAEITFVGAWDLEREKALEPLVDFDLALWGPGWQENLGAASPLKKRVRGGGIYGRDLVLAYKASKLVFNHLRTHNGSAHNVRTMEICGIGGGVQVVRRTPEQSKELFQEGEHLFCFDSTEELRVVVQNALANPALCERISRQAQQHVLHHHLMKFRVQTIADDLAELAGQSPTY